MIAARASSTVASAARPSATAPASSSVLTSSMTMGAAGRRSRDDHQMLTTTAATIATTSSAYRMGPHGMCNEPPGPGAGGSGRGVPGGRASWRGSDRGLTRKCRCRLVSSTTATAAMQPASSQVSVNRSACGGSMSCSAVPSYGRACAARLAADSRRRTISSSAPKTTSTASPIAMPEPRSGPFQRGAGTTPRSPAATRTTRSTSGSSRAICCRAVTGCGSYAERY